MKFFAQQKKGFSLLETILAISLILIALTFSVLYYQTSQLRADVNTQANILVSHLRVLQSNAMSGNFNKPTSMHLENDAYTLFTGLYYTPNDPNNYTTTLPATIRIENIALNGGANNITFIGPSGETNNYGSFNLAATQINKIITINISNIGSINY